MPETAVNPEQFQHATVESFDETRERIRQTEIVNAETSPRSVELNYVRGEYGWSLSMADIEKVGTPLDPQNPDDSALLQEANHALTEDAGTIDAIAHYVRWWESATANISQEVESGITDRLVIRNPETEDQLDIVNCTQEALTQEEQAAVLRVMESVANFTGNKIFDRTRGVVLADSKHFNKDALGLHSTYSQGIISINLEDIRQLVQNGSKDYVGRYEQYLPGDSAPEDTLAIVLAHELGHAMDIRTTDEARKMGVETEGKLTNAMGGMTGDFSLFDEGLGWSDGSVVFDPDKKTHVRQWKIDPAQEVELREQSPTNYGKLNPREDLAETFAILALGGKRDQLPHRLQKLADGLSRLHEADQHGPFRLELEHETATPLPARIPEQIVVKAGISKTLTAA